MKPPSACTLADVGRRAGVSAATASMALRNNPRISAPTRKKVHQAARTLGYVPDPILSALVARRDQARPRRVFANLAALIDDRWLSTARHEWLEDILRGMRSASRRLGYHLEELRMEGDLGHQSEPDRLLLARGIRGVALLPPLDDQFDLKIDWENYAAVVIGNSALGQVLNRVGSDAFASVHLICEKLARLGYRRVGLALHLGTERRLRFQSLGALSKEQFLAGSRIHVVRPHLPEEMAEGPFLTWVKKERPEAIIAAGIEETLSWLKNGGYQVPRDVGVAFLSLHTTKPPHPSGISQHLEVCGETAIEQLHSSLLRGERGYPPVPRATLIRSHWIDGTTLKPKPPGPAV